MEASSKWHKTVTPKKIMQLNHRMVPASPLTGDQWPSKITEVIDPSKTEVEGIRPLMHQLIDACVHNESDAYVIKFEEPYEARDYIVQKPDTSLFLRHVIHQHGESISALTMPIEAAKLGDLLRAVGQGMGYVVARIMAQVPIAELSNTLCGYCIGCDGISIIIGYAEVKDMELHTYHTDASGIPLWPVSGPPPRYFLFNFVV